MSTGGCGIPIPATSRLYTDDLHRCHCYIYENYEKPCDDYDRSCSPITRHRANPHPENYDSPDSSTTNHVTFRYHWCRGALIGSARVI